MPDRRFRIFISSPSDVFPERERVERVIARLNGEFGGNLLEAIRWERTYYTAAKTFQDQIPLPSQTDLVVCILWKRLGFELPPDYRRADGTTPTGTEYEFEDAMQAARANGTPDVLVYRKLAPVLLDAAQIQTEQAQFEALKLFWSRWFQTETGHFTAAYQSFETTDELETRLEDHIRQWLGRHKVAATGVSWPIDQRGSPFRGLQPFDADHAAVFFGRRRAIEHARERLADAAARGTPFLLILGTSGAGKSSMARAGLLPRLMQPGAVAGIDVWRSCVMRPGEGDTPLHALARALYRPDALPELAAGDNPTPPDLAGLLATAPEAAARAIKISLTRATAAVAAREGFDRPVEARLVLLVDQFEEAFLPPASRDAFARALTALAASGAVWIIATLRSDLYAPFQSSPTLVALRDAGAQFDLLPPTTIDLAEIVTGPAAAAGLRFDTRPDGTGLDEELIRAADQPGALPLLQLALDALFEARDPAANLLTSAAYDALGGLPGVVERRAETTLAALDPAASATLPAVLGALVDVSGDGVVTGRTIPLARAAATPDAARLVDAFVAARLLVADSNGGKTRLRVGSETRLRVAHDALLSGWPRAAALIATDRDLLRTRSRVDEAARRWLQEARDADFLLPPGRPLAEAVELATQRPDSIEPDSADFIAASRAADAARQADAAAHAQRELRLEGEAQKARADAATRVVRRTRAAVAVVSLLLLIAAGTAVYATTQRREAQRQTAEAERNFQAALAGGASMVDAVNAHLRDGGMTRAVASALLGTASTTLGSLAQGRDGLPPPLLDTQGRLQAGFSNVQLALCDSVGARARAEQAVAIAETVEKQSPSDARQLALVQALDVLGQAVRGDGDAAGALAAYRRAETIATKQATQAGPWADALRALRRNIALALLDQENRDAALILLRTDLAWQHSLARPDDPAVLALIAIDLRRIAFATLAKHDFSTAADALGQEAEILNRLATLQPANLEWQRALSINAQADSQLQSAKGDRVAALKKSREAADLAAAVLAHDPDNAEWQRDLVFTNVRLGSLLAGTGDVAATVRVLQPAVAKVRSLTSPDSSSLLCKGDAARLHDLAGLALMLTGDGKGAAAELETGLAVTQAIAAKTPDDPVRQHAVVAAQLQLVHVLDMAEQPGLAAAHARAGIETVRHLIAQAGSTPEREGELADLRLGLGDVLRKSGDLPGALAAYQEDQAASETLAAAQPENPAWQHQLVVSQLRIATTHMLAKQPDAQWAALQKAATGADRLIQLQPDSPAAKSDLYDIRTTIAAAELARGDFPAGLAHYREALDLAETLLARNPADPRWRIAQAVTLTYVGIAYKFNQQPDVAQTYLDRGKAAMEAMQKKPPAPTP